jgi:CRISPR associated protein Cas2
MRYLISYDLRKQRNYQPLYDELKRLNAVRVLESDWFVKRPGTNAEKLREQFRPLIDSDDGIFVVEVNDWASYNAQSNPNVLS